MVMVTLGVLLVVPGLVVGLAAGEEHKDIIDSLEADEREASIASPRGGGPANQERNVGA